MAEGRQILFQKQMKSKEEKIVAGYLVKKVLVNKSVNKEWLKIVGPERKRI